MGSGDSCRVSIAQSHHAIASLCVNFTRQTTIVLSIAELPKTGLNQLFKLSCPTEEAHSCALLQIIEAKCGRWFIISQGLGVYNSSSAC